MPLCVIIGGTGVMGTAAIQGLREHFKSEARVVANWFGKENPGFEVDQADVTVFGDVSTTECLDRIKAAAGGPIDYLFYATALGAVGFPIKEANPEQIAQSNHLSFDPMKTMEAHLDVDTIVGYSTFYLTRHQLGSYGAMGYSKEAIEKWTVAPGKSKHVCIRAGLFESPSSRGIKLLLRKTAKDLNNLTDPLVRSYFENVPSSEGVENFLAGIIDEERQLYGDSPTLAENLKQAHVELFRSADPVFVNVCGKKIWHSKDPQLIPATA
ncbi:MAG: hypothetical protein ACE5ER_08150 [Nitrospinaceae bacterium]